MIGSRFGHFRILAELGAGGMGVVYRAVDERFGRTVALKFLPPHQLQDPLALDLFRREAQALARLNHPGIAILHDFHSAEGRDFLVMEFVEGESLAERLRRGPVPEAELRELARQFAEALAAAHKQGIVHRDLKPANLQLTPGGRLKILDFGLAHCLEQGTSNLTELVEHPGGGTPTVMGTLPYLAPELLRGAPASPASDLYAAGLVLYEASTGRRPFPGLPASALAEAILNRVPPSPRSLSPGLSRSFESVILRCLHKDPARRFADADELAWSVAPSAGALSPAAGAHLRRGLLAGLAGAIAIVAAVAFLSARSRAGPIRSLAVLPLADLSGGSAPNYFTEGMGEELNSRLSRIHALRVVAWLSTRTLTTRGRSARELTAGLGVDGLVEGSVLRAGDSLRITVHLVDGRADAEVWSQEYRSDTTQVLALQSRMAQSIAEEIRVRLSGAERSRLQSVPQVDPGALSLYRQARFEWNGRGAPGVRRAIEDFSAAIAKDSTFAPAYAGLADAWASLGLYAFVPPREAREHAYAAAQRAVQLEPEASEGHTSLGHILHNFDWNWDGAEREYRRAIELNHNDANAHHFLAHLLAQEGRLDEARTEIQTAVALAPGSTPTLLGLGIVEYFAGRYERALAHYAAVERADPAYSLVFRARAAALDRLGRQAEAAAALTHAVDLTGPATLAAGMRQATAASGLDGALEVLVGALLRKRAAGAYEPAEHVAELYGRLGRIDEAFAWLETAYREHDTELNRLRSDPVFTPLRSDPRFASLLRRVGLDRRRTRA